MLRRVLAASAGAALLFAASASAQDDEEDLPYADARTYIQMGGTNGVEQFDLSPATVVNTLGFNIRVGKRIQPHFAAETQFEYLPNFDVRMKRPGLSEARESPDIYNFGFNLKGFPLTGPIQPYLLAGFGGTVMAGGGKGITTSGGNDVGLSGRVGAGLDIYFFDDFGMSLEAAYVLPTGAVRDLQHLTVSWSLVYRFSSDEDE